MLKVEIAEDVVDIMKNEDSAYFNNDSEDNVRFVSISQHQAQLLSHLIIYSSTFLFCFYCSSMGLRPISDEGVGELIPVSTDVSVLSMLIFIIIKRNSTQ